MKSQRTYLVMSILWIASAVALVACSDKVSNNNGVQCPIGMIQMNGICSLDGGIGGSGGGGWVGNYGFNPNGNILNTDAFRDFNYRLYNYKYFCVNAYPYNCKDVQVRVQQVNSTYYVYMSSPSLGTGGGATVALQAEKFQYTGQSQVIFEVYASNPYPYIIGELVMNNGLDSASTPYTFNYKTNAGLNNGTPIVSGIMTKIIDY